jgi:NAD-dependent deacetylase
MTYHPLHLGPGDRLFVLTGAGISAESGIATFRDAGGLWQSHRVEDVASPTGWARDPALLWRFYSERRDATRAARPNAAHLALAELERIVGERMIVCTQNIDRLHEAAGSRRVVHVHGDLFRSRCSSTTCSSNPVDDENVYLSADALPRCATCGSLMRPDIVWFGEEPRRLGEIDEALESCSLFVAIGTSGLVYPVAGFVKFLRARRPGTRTVYVGLQVPGNAEAFDEIRLGSATALVPGLLSAQNEA